MRAAEYWPSGQYVQFAAPATLKPPLLQGRQLLRADAPVTGWYLPVPQIVHTCDVVAPTLPL